MERIEHPSLYPSHRRSVNSDSDSPSARHRSGNVHTGHSAYRKSNERRSARYRVEFAGDSLFFGSDGMALG
jgi:hypothetical protein